MTDHVAPSATRPSTSAKMGRSGKGVDEGCTMVGANQTESRQQTSSQPRCVSSHKAGSIIRSANGRLQKAGEIEKKGNLLSTLSRSPPRPPCLPTLHQSSAPGFSGLSLSRSRFGYQSSERVHERRGGGAAISERVDTEIKERERMGEMTSSFT